ncbi:uncharacterized protein LOC125501915 isoform X2 [Athalia rosae]|uniref:uncharacterized protein LOC125501915 isoform X2 n=1 Tax=Athalia rosae TaxID=37344 RepID=UPI002033A43D|nr:uncharacterized protein LOC125501915 isoform X2 [Athalia rosae]
MTGSLNVIQSGEWLYDDHIDHFSLFLKNSTEYAPQETWRVQMADTIEPVSPTVKHVQILHSGTHGGQHWNTLQFPTVQRQPNGSDCGVFGIVVAISLINGKKPDQFPCVEEINSASAVRGISSPKPQMRREKIQTKNSPPQTKKHRTSSCNRLTNEVSQNKNLRENSQNGAKKGRAEVPNQSAKEVNKRTESLSRVYIS